MLKSSLQWIMVILAKLNLIYGSETCYQEAVSQIYNINDGTRNVNSGVMKKLLTPSQITCVHRCKLQEGCQSINYNTDTKECELLASECFPAKVNGNVGCVVNTAREIGQWKHIYF